jgi:hypothetical protein
VGVFRRELSKAFSLCAFLSVFVPEALLQKKIPSDLERLLNLNTTSFELSSAATFHCYLLFGRGPEVSLDYCRVRPGFVRRLLARHLFLFVRFSEHVPNPNGIYDPNVQKSSMLSRLDFYMFFYYLRSFLKNTCKQISHRDHHNYTSQ